MRGLLLVLAGCGRIGFDPSGATDANDANGDAMACTLGPWSQAMPISAANTAGRESAPALSPDGLSLVFMSDRPGGQGDIDLYMTTRTTQQDAFAGVSELVANGTLFDGEATFSGDGLSLVFETKRAGPSQLWRATRGSTSAAFGTATRMTVGTLPDEMGPALSADDEEMLLTAFGPTRLFLALETGGVFAFDRDLSELGDTANGWGSLSADRLAIYWECDRGAGTNEICTASRITTSTTFNLITELDLGCTGNAIGPEISKDDRTLIFACDTTGSFDLLAVTRSCM